jgi:hypothetical protein
MDSVFNDDEHDTDVGNANAKNAQVLGWFWRSRTKSLSPAQTIRVGRGEPGTV